MVQLNFQKEKMMIFREKLDKFWMEFQQKAKILKCWWNQNQEQIKLEELNKKLFKMILLIQLNG